MHLVGSFWFMQKHFLNKNISNIFRKKEKNYAFISFLFFVLDFLLYFKAKISKETTTTKKKGTEKKTLQQCSLYIIEMIIKARL